MINLNKLIVHEIIKDTGTNHSVVRTSEELLPNNEDSATLVFSLINSYKGDKILYANFDDQPDRHFPKQFDRYRQSPRKADDFVEFTKSAIQQLDPIIKAKNLAKGGYFVFSEYELGGINYLSIFLIRDTEGKILRRTELSYAIQTIDYLDTNHLAMACQINEDRLGQNESNYLSFTKYKQRTVSDYFTDWICVQQLESSTEYTKSLYRIINQIETPLNSETNEAYTIDEFRHLVYDFARSNPQKRIDIHALSEHLYDDSNKIMNFAEARQIPIDTEFHYDASALKKFVRLHVNKDGINMKFSRGDFDHKVRFSAENENIIIIESESFAEALRKELNNE